MDVRPVVHFGMKTIEEKVVISISQIKQQSRFEKPGMCCWNLPEVNSRMSPTLLWIVHVILQIHYEQWK